MFISKKGTNVISLEDITELTNGVVLVYCNDLPAARITYDGNKDKWYCHQNKTSNDLACSSKFMTVIEQLENKYSNLTYNFISFSEMIPNTNN